MTEPFPGEKLGRPLRDAVVMSVRARRRVVNCRAFLLRSNLYLAFVLLLISIELPSIQAQTFELPFNLGKLRVYPK